jgi:hypothetical protein
MKETFRHLAAIEKQRKGMVLPLATLFFGTDIPNSQHTGRPDLIRSPKRVLAHTWEGF